MAKNSSKLNISNDQFEAMRIKYQKNLDDIKKTLALTEKDFALKQEEFKLREGKNYKLKPEFAYEETPAWKEFIERVNKIAFDEKFAETQKNIDYLKQAIKAETARVKLISEGVPAWNSPFDNDKLLQEYDARKLTE